MKFPIIEKYLADLTNPPEVEKVYSIRLVWTCEVNGRKVPEYAWLTGFEKGEYQKSNQPNLAVPMTGVLANRVLHRVLSKYPKSVIEESLSDQEVKTDLQQLGFIDSIEAIRESVRNAVADGMSQKDIWNIVNSAVQG